jgi:pimeloyl-ACP methyl ester carboxylesterase
MKRFLSIALLLVFTLASCTLPTNSIETTQTVPEDSQSPTSGKHCGDGICDGPENHDICPQDCPTAHSQPVFPDENGVQWVTNPTSGAKLYVKMFIPAHWDFSHLATLVLIPGGLGDSSTFDDDKQVAQTMADQGYTIVIFDPDGRGRSEGEEDKNGYIQQDGLAEIIRTISQAPEVDPARIGLVSYSYGVTLGSGVLARYPDLPVKFFIDWEGPANREYTTHGCAADQPGIGDTLGMASCEDDAFWSQREAETFIADILIPYQRIQFENDHSQDEPTHGLVMVNAAVAGTSPWVRLNDLPPNQTYDLNNPPSMLPASSGNKLNDLILQYAEELFAMP